MKHKLIHGYFKIANAQDIARQLRAKGFKCNPDRMRCTVIYTNNKDLNIDRIKATAPSAIKAKITGVCRLGKFLTIQIESVLLDGFFVFTFSQGSKWEFNGFRPIITFSQIYNYYKYAIIQDVDYHKFDGYAILTDFQIDVAEH